MTSSSSNNSSTTRSSNYSSNHLHHLHHHHHTHHIFATDSISSNCSSKTTPSKTKMGTQISSTEIDIAAPVSYFIIFSISFCVVFVFSLLSYFIEFFVSFKNNKNVRLPSFDQSMPALSLGGSCY